MLEVAKKIDSLLEAKIIRRVTNPWGSLIHLVNYLISATLEIHRMIVKYLV